jgi:hypothetical protein
MSVKRINSNHRLYLCRLYLIPVGVENKELADFSPHVPIRHEERDSSWQPLEN